jgi:hypothetical protein
MWASRRRIKKIVRRSINYSTEESANIYSTWRSANIYICRRSFKVHSVIRQSHLFEEDVPYIRFGNHVCLKRTCPTFALRDVDVNTLLPRQVFVGTFLPMN